MSNLVLPENYRNKVLEANLQAFFARYPYERDRLELLLSTPVENREVARVELPPVPSHPPMRVLILAGIGSPFFLNDILNDKTIKQETFQIFICENNLDFLAFCFQYVNLVPSIMNQKVEWLLMHNAESAKPAFFRVMKREHVASMMRNIYIIQTQVPQPEEALNFYKQLASIYDETVHHVMHNFGRIDDSLDGVRATLLNKNAILDNPGIEDLKGEFKNLPALIIGAGPSLDRELDNIKANNDRFIIICADAALKPLINAGIRVDYVTSIERLNNYQKPFFEGMAPVETELVAFPVVLPSQFELYPGPIRLVYRNYSYFAYFQKSWPKGIIKCGGSTSHLAIRLADWFGCSKAYLIGIDSSYEQKEGTDLYRSHCSGTGHSEWGEFVSLSDFVENRKHLPPIKALNNQGKEVMTNMTYYQWIKEYTEELSEVCQRMTVINCSETGLKIEGINFQSFSEAVKNLDSVVIKKPKRGPALYNRIFHHKEIVRNFERWGEMIKDLQAECEALFKQDQIDQIRLESLIFVYNFRICVDPLFVAFIVQCCAKEFFELENKWWALEQAFTLNQKEKIVVIKERLDLFKYMIDQTLAIFREGSLV